MADSAGRGPVSRGIATYKYWLAAGAALLVEGAARAAVIEDLTQLSIEELANIEVTSVSKKAEPLSAAPAAIYVITGDDIRRSGVTSVPEALRLAPNLEVARLDALSHTISARGFNSTEASNKLLVLVDGRSVYSPLHSGVLWDAQDMMLEDIERIEVIGGPGGTLWGANAVNGVINIISKPASATHGGLITGNYGTIDDTIAGRFGGQAGGVDYRLYAKAFQRDHSRNPDGTNHIDAWDHVQGGFNFGYGDDTNQFTLHGDAYTGSLDAAVGDETSGKNAVFTWSRAIGTSLPIRVQAYYDRTHRNQSVLTETVKTADIEVQHGFDIGTQNQIIWGGGYRSVHDTYDVPPPFGVVTKSAHRQLANAFVQDELTLSPTFKATAGIKIEHHTATGFEFLPNLRLSWRPSETMLWWAAASQAVRTPSRLDRELVALPILIPAPNFDSETLTAYELGYRGELAPSFTLSISTFYNEYDGLRTTSLLPPGAGALAQLQNGMDGHTYGAEIWGQYALTEFWRLSGGLMILRKRLGFKPGVIDASNMQAAGNDPGHQVQLRSIMTPLPELEFDVGLRVIGELRSAGIPSYTEIDARVGLHISEHLDFNVTAFNLVNKVHPEGGPVNTRRLIRRSVNAGFAYRF